MKQDRTPWQLFDVLSPPARSAAEANGAVAYTRLVVREGGNPDVRETLSSLRPETVLTVPVQSTDDARAVLAGLWLWHDWLDQSHSVSQSLATPNGSFWHAIMHRREGDFSNSKYWYARCRHHPAMAAIAAMARSVTATASRDRLLGRLVEGEWDPDGFVDVVQAVHHKPDDPLYAACVELQRVEWQALFAHCARRATGDGRRA